MKRRKKLYNYYLSVIGIFFMFSLNIPVGAEERLDNNDQNIKGTVTDIDGNEYKTVNIGNQEWMAENLRTTRYKDSSNIEDGLSHAKWANIEEGAYSVFPHENVDDIDSRQEMVKAYGKLYNWYTVADTRGICPEGWHVPSDDEWSELINYIINNYADIDEYNIGNALKSCRQVDSPLGGDCDTNKHPVWVSHKKHYGTDNFGFSALPGGYRSYNGIYYNIGNSGFWWTSTQSLLFTVWGRSLSYRKGTLEKGNDYENVGFSIRCLRYIED